MDITLFCNDEKENKHSNKLHDEKVFMSISKSKINEYTKILNKLYDNKKINENEHTFMLIYIKVGGTIINIEKL